ncbi:39S ribosomal protein L39, mitochondrial [Patella vulgata]|uniref:39S ribosomal protein L39, mitochondrial n=1 Tax=Patella vulgata TaxID=6465 RepID=UPI0021808721|nr:39S ribosomal protein L39, mitochondrial [Patella vulgata]
MAASMSCKNVFLKISSASRRNLKRSYCQSTNLTNAEVRRKRNEIFETEKKRQLGLITRMEKIQVDVKGPPEDCTLIMNKGISTPFNCSMHIQELLVNRSALALVNGEPWDMHRPLKEDCSIEFLHFLDEDPRIVNKAFWRSCCLVLGHVLETALQNQYYVELCSFPKPHLQSGSFVYDADLKLKDWKPTTAELNCLTRVGYKLHHLDFKFERLEVDASVALDMFKDNHFKSQQIPYIAESSGSKVVVYRVGDHVDISSGPCIASTNQIGRFNVTAAHQIDTPDYGKLYRVQGLGLPSQVMMHYWSYDILRRRAGKFNTAPLPRLNMESSPHTDDNTEIST